MDSPRDYYASLGYSNITEVSKASWMGLCLPMGE